MRKIDQLLAILGSQESDPRDWDTLSPRIEETEDELVLEVDVEQVGFAFDKSGEKFLGMFNWQE